MLFNKYINIFLKYCILNFVIFSFILIIKRHISPGILFHEGITSLVVSTLILLLYTWKSSNGSFNRFHKIYMIIISFFFILTFHTTVITIVDRSISVFLIARVHNGVYTPTMIKNEFVDNFSGSGIDKRIEEQVEIGNIKFEKKNLHLSWKGKLYYSFFSLIQNVYNTDKRIFTTQIEK